MSSITAVDEMIILSKNNLTSLESSFSLCCLLHIPITVRSLTFRMKINTDFPDVNLLERSDKTGEAESGGVERKYQKFTNFKTNENILII